MPDTSTAPTAPLPPAVPLLRRPDDRVFRGVCAAVGRSTGTDPVLWRVVLGVLVLFGGSGAVLYAAGWLLIPEEGADGSHAEQWYRGGRPARAVLAVAAAGAALLWLRTADGGDAVALLAVAALAYVVLKHPSPAAAAASTGTGTGTHTGPLSGSVPLTAAPAPSWSPPAPRPPRRRSSLGLLTVSLALLVTGALLGLRALGEDGVTLGRVLAADLLVVGLGLVVGARWGRARGLVLLALPLAGALALTAAARVPVDLSAGQRTWRVSDAASYRLGVGEAFLDLRPLAGTAAPPAAPVTARLGAGHLVVQVPDGLHVELTARVAGGELLLPGEAPRSDGPDLRATRSYGPVDAPSVVVDVRLGAGQLEVDSVPR